jgi:hypothetical protein
MSSAICLHPVVKCNRSDVLQNSLRLAEAPKSPTGPGKPDGISSKHPSHSADPDH